MLSRGFCHRLNFIFIISFICQTRPNPRINRLVPSYHATENPHHRSSRSPFHRSIEQYRDGGPAVRGPHVVIGSFGSSKDSIKVKGVDVRTQHTPPRRLALIVRATLGSTARYHSAQGFQHKPGFREESKIVLGCEQTAIMNSGTRTRVVVTSPENDLYLSRLGFCWKCVS